MRDSFFKADEFLIFEAVYCFTVAVNDCDANISQCSVVPKILMLVRGTSGGINRKSYCYPNKTLKILVAIDGVLGHSGSFDNF